MTTITQHKHLDAMFVMKYRVRKLSTKPQLDIAMLQESLRALAAKCATYEQMIADYQREIVRLREIVYEVKP